MLRPIMKGFSIFMSVDVAAIDKKDIARLFFNQDTMRSCRTR